jgi:ATP phosphoribosyltransferase regulatory subunit
MRQEDRWLLPDGIDQALPAQAARIERLRREVLDLFVSWGYELVLPPLVEYLESLLTGLGSDLDLQTFKLTDHMTGRLMGIRADMTPQVARIDSHALKREVPSRLCYLGPVLHTRAGGFAGSRNPLQVGAELYGHKGLESDIEVLKLMVETLRLAQQPDLLVNVSHIGIFRGLIERLGVDAEREGLLFDALQRKNPDELQTLLDGADGALASAFISLTDLSGGAEILAQARQVLANVGEEVTAALEELARIAELVPNGASEVELHFDLAELRGYHYHTGVMFEAYVPGQGAAVAWGGRYDDVGSAFGRSRPATGFSSDLKVLAHMMPTGVDSRAAIFAPDSDDPELHDEVARLRAGGHCVVSALPNQTGDAAMMGCERELAKLDDAWTIRDVE